MPDLVRFSEQYPEIDLKMLISYDVFDLSRREADVAIRVYGDNRMPPDDLVGRKLGAVSSCYYASENYLKKHDLEAPDTTARWIGWNDEEPFPQWVKDSPFPNVPAYGNFSNGMLQVAAVEHGMGLAALPCFLGDQIPGVVRIPGCEPYSNYDVWMLTHPDLRDAARHRVFREFIVDVFRKKASLVTTG